jgi:predicted ArsR family transcriptional regulator
MTGDADRDAITPDDEGEPVDGRRRDAALVDLGAELGGWAVNALQLQARALGDPTRHEVFRYIADAGRPVDVAELTEHVGLHHNAIRQHLAKLVDAGLVSEATASPVGRGRPRLCYLVDPSAESRWGVTGPYERLTLLLSEIIRTGDSPIDVGRRAGRQVRVATGATVDDPVAGLVGVMQRQGFEPTATRRGRRTDIVLGACPFETTALADPDTVCGLHLGLALGAAEALDGLVIDELVPRDPRRGACRLRCHVES